MTAVVIRCNVPCVFFSFLYEYIHIKDFTSWYYRYQFWLLLLNFMKMQKLKILFDLSSFYFVHFFMQLGFTRLSHSEILNKVIFPCRLLLSGFLTIKIFCVAYSNSKLRLRPPSISIRKICSVRYFIMLIHSISIVMLLFYSYCR